MLLSRGSFALWFLSVATLTIAVFYPLVPSTFQGPGLGLMTAQALRFLGAFAIFAAISLTATLQLGAGSIYRKALQDKIPNQIEVWLWGMRRYALLIPFLMAAGISFATGLCLFLLPGATLHVPAADHHNLRTHSEAPAQPVRPLRAA